MSNLKLPPAIVFTTAYGDHALEAFDAQAIDYLLKPIRPERLLQALEKSQRFFSGQIQQLSTSSGQRTHLCASNHGNLELIPADEIIFFLADQKYVTVGSQKKQILIEDSLKILEEEFGDDFIRIHRNALVRASAIRGLEKNLDGQCRIVLEGVDERLEVSRRLLPEVRKIIKSGS